MYKIRVKLIRFKIVCRAYTYSEIIRIPVSLYVSTNRKPYMIFLLEHVWILQIYISTRSVDIITILQLAIIVVIIL